jgi:malate permease and related proteins
MTIFIQVVLPILVIFLVGFIIQKWRKMDLKSISTLAVYILTPTLVFKTFYSVELDKQYLYITIFSLLLLFILVLVNKLYAKVRKYPKNVESALILSTAFMNAGNYGAPIILFAYGEVGFAYAISFFVLQSMIMNFFGLYYAARGERGVGDAVKSVLKMPLTYTLVVAILLNITNITLPTNILSAVDLVSAATIPVVMLILGMQLAELKTDAVEDHKKVIFGVLIRMIFSPCLALIFILFFPLEPLLEKVLIVLTAMPTAVTTTMYALQYGTLPKLVSSIALATTLVSVVTITVLISLLG